MHVSKSLSFLSIGTAAVIPIIVVGDDAVEGEMGANEGDPSVRGNTTAECGEGDYKGHHHRSPSRGTSEKDQEVRPTSRSEPETNNRYTTTLPGTTLANSRHPGGPRGRGA